MFTAFSKLVSCMHSQPISCCLSKLNIFDCSNLFSDQSLQPHSPMWHSEHRSICKVPLNFKSRTWKHDTCAQTHLSGCKFDLLVSRTNTRNFLLIVEESWGRRNPVCSHNRHRNSPYNFSRVLPSSSVSPSSAEVSWGVGGHVKWCVLIPCAASEDKSTHCCSTLALLSSSATISFRGRTKFVSLALGGGARSPAFSVLFS